jgi:hypothetical protein
MKKIRPKIREHTKWLISYNQIYYFTLFSAICLFLSTIILALIDIKVYKSDCIMLMIFTLLFAIMCFIVSRKLHTRKH